MKQILILILLVLVCRSKLLKVDSVDSIDKIVKDNENVLIMFSVEWCETCKEIKPILTELSDQMQNVSLVVGDITSQQDSELKKIYQEYNIRSFPTFYGFKNGMKQQFKKFRINKQSINHFINNIANLKYQMVSVNELTKLYKNDRIVVSLTIDRSNDQHLIVQEIFRQLAQSMNSKAKFYLVDSNQTVNPSLMLYNNPNEINTTFSGNYSLNSLKKFVKANLQQVIAEYDLSGPMEINKGKFSLLVLIEDEQENKQEISQLYDTAELIKQQIPGQLLIRYIVKQKLPEEAVQSVYDRFESLSGLSKEQMPRMYLLYDDINDEYLYRVEGQINAQNIISQFKKARDGSLERIYKSEPIPDQQDPFVHQLVYNSFNQLIDNTKKDLLIYFYADWSKECNQFTPKFQKIAQEYNAINADLQFVKYNVDKNDHVYELQHLPTLVYFNHKAQMYIRIKGKLSKKNIIKKIEKYSQEHQVEEKQDL